jgi:hypothetical protein
MCNGTGSAIGEEPGNVGAYYIRHPFSSLLEYKHSSEHKGLHVAFSMDRLSSIVVILGAGVCQLSGWILLRCSVVFLQNLSTWPLPAHR